MRQSIFCLVLLIILVGCGTHSGDRDTRGDSRPLACGGARQ